MVGQQLLHLTVRAVVAQVGSVLAQDYLLLLERTIRLQLVLVAQVRQQVLLLLVFLVLIQFFPQ